MAEPAVKKARALELVAAAKSLLEEKGYSSLTARAVAERAGVNKGLVFYYFRSTTELFEKVLDDYYERHRADLERGFFAAEDAPLRVRLHNLIDAFFESLLANRVYAQIVQEQIATGGPHIEIVRKHFARLLDWTRQMFASVLPENGSLSARQFHISLSGLVTHYFTHAPVFGEALWGSDPLSGDSIEERLAHLHWVVDAWLDALEREGVAVEIAGT